MGKEIKEQIKETLLRGGSVLLVAPTGWGKTRLMLELAVELSRHGRVGVFAPTLTLLVRKWPELLSLSPPSALLTAGAGQHCVYRWSYPQRFCPRCRLRRPMLPEGFQPPPVATFEDLLRLTPEEVCSYWIQEIILHHYSIILAHYGRITRLWPLLHYAFIDEAHELFLPHISSIPLAEVAELLGTDPQELNSIAVIKEAVEAALAGPLDPAREDKLHMLLQMLRKTCWIEEGDVPLLNCMDLYNTPSGRPIFAATATPPPGFPPPGWEVVEIKAEKRPRAYIVADMAFYYPDYHGAALLLWLIRRRFPDHRIAVFATSSLRNVLALNLPPGVELYLRGLVDAWGKMRVGVDLPQFDTAIVFWPSLHVSARRRLRAEGRDPTTVELIQAVQLAGRVLRPRPGESHDDVIQKRIIVFADGRFAKHGDYIARYFEISILQV